MTSSYVAYSIQSFSRQRQLRQWKIRACTQGLHFPCFHTHFHYFFGHLQTLCISPWYIQTITQFLSLECSNSESAHTLSRIPTTYYSQITVQCSFACLARTAHHYVYLKRANKTMDLSIEYYCQIAVRMRIFQVRRVPRKCVHNENIQIPNTLNNVIYSDWIDTTGWSYASGVL